MKYPPQTYSLNSLCDLLSLSTDTALVKTDDTPTTGQVLPWSERRMAFAFALRWSKLFSLILATVRKNQRGEPMQNNRKRDVKLLSQRQWVPSEPSATSNS